MAESSPAGGQNALLEQAAWRVAPQGRRFRSYVETTLAQYQTGRGDQKTNIIDQGARATYALPRHETQGLFNQLLSLYHAGIAANFSERQGTPEAPETGIMLDYDLIVTDPKTRLTARHIHRLAQEIVRVMHASLEFEAEDALVPVFSIVKARPAPLQERGEGGERLFKYGFHLLLPGVRVSKGYKRHLIGELRRAQAHLRVLADLGAYGDHSEVLDGGSATVPVLFVGSCKKGGAPYDVGPAFEVSFEARAADFFPVVTEIRWVAEAGRRDPGADPAAEGPNLIAELSLCFEADYADGSRPRVPVVPTRPRAEVAAAVGALETGAAQAGELGETALHGLFAEDAEAKYIHQLLEILGPEYHENRNRWRDVVFALANTGGDPWRPLAEWFSARYGKWRDRTSKRVAAFPAMWEDAVARRSCRRGFGSQKEDAGGGAVLTQRSIHEWARACDPRRMREISDQSYYMKLGEFAYEYGGNIEQAMVAEVIYAMQSHRFVVDVDYNPRRKWDYCWFEFVSGSQAAEPGQLWKWRMELEPDSLRVFLTKTLPRVFGRVLETFERQRDEAEDDKKAKYFERIGKALMGSQRRLFNSGFQRGVIEQAAFLFRRRGFAKTLDTDPRLIGVGNGVLQLGPRCALLATFHEHPVMRFTSVPYRPFNPEDPWVRLILGAIADIVPEPDAREKMLFFIASSLGGGLKEGLLLLWRGGGANGKTFIMQLAARVFGDYGNKLDINILTQEARPGPDTVLMALKGLRWGYIEETQTTEVLNSARLKTIVNPGQVSGNDKNKAQETFDVTANVAVGHNHDLVIPDNGHGCWRRLLYYNSKVKFTERPDPRNPFEKKDDPRYLNEFVMDPDCQAAFLSILVHFYERLQREFGGIVKRVPCPTIERETAEYRVRQDTLFSFAVDSVVHSPVGCEGNPAPGAAIPVEVFTSRYKEWFSSNVTRGQRGAITEPAAPNIDDSVLSKYVRTLANGTKVLVNVRILPSDSRALYAGEEYLANLRPKGGEGGKDLVADLIARAPADWWNGIGDSARGGRGEEPSDGEGASDGDEEPGGAGPGCGGAPRPAPVSAEDEEFDQAVAALGAPGKPRRAAVEPPKARGISDTQVLALFHQAGSGGGGYTQDDLWT